MRTIITISIGLLVLIGLTTGGVAAEPVPATTDTPTAIQDTTVVQSGDCSTGPTNPDGDTDSVKECLLDQ